MSAQPVAGPYVAVMLTPVEAREIARMIRSELASKCEETLAAPLPGRDELAALRVTIDSCAKQLEMLDWGEPQADIEMVCPTELLDVIGQDLLDGGEETIREHDLAVCAVLGGLARRRRSRTRAPAAIGPL